MIEIVIISVGKRHDPAFASAIKHYEERLQHYCRFSWQLIPDSGHGPTGVSEENAAILQKLRATDAVIALDTHGKVMSSEALSTVIEDLLPRSNRLVCIIGGAYGLTEAVRQRANIVWSLGPATYPHQLVRVIVSEQLYRAFSIIQGTGYHHP